MNRKPVTRKEYYVNYILNGGELSELPKPETREEEYLYGICTDGLGYDEITHKNTIPYVKAVLHSDAGATNFLVTCLDLKNRRIKEGEEVRVKFRFKLKNTGKDKPKSIGIRLFGNSSPVLSMSEYLHTFDNLITETEFDKEYVIENVFPILSTNNSQQKDLKTYRHIKPYLMLNKNLRQGATSNNNLTHGIEVYEAKVFIGSDTFDLLDSIQDFGGKADSAIEKINVKKEKYIEAVLNSQASGQNYMGVVYDLGTAGVVNGTTSKAKVKFVFKIKNTGTMPSSIQLRLFADPTKATVNELGSYMHTFNEVLDDILEFDKEYTIEGEFPVQGNNVQLNTCRYLKAFLMFNKRNSQDNTHLEATGIEVSKATIIIKDIEYDVMDTAEDVSPKAKSSIKILDKEEKKISHIKSLHPYGGKTFAIIGDSIVWGLNPNDIGNISQVKKRHTDKTKELCKFNKVYNYGISSTTVSVINGQNQVRRPICLRYKYMTDNADVIAVAGGINDYWLKVPLGNINSTTNTDFYGAYKSLISGLITKYPDKKIFAITPLDFDATSPADVNRNTNTLYSLQAMRDAIKNVCALYGVPVLEIHKEIGFSSAVPSQKAKYMPDGLHLSQAGNDAYADRVAHFINTRL